MIDIISADERLEKKLKVNIAMFGPSGVGKTTQARTLDPETTLFIDLEAGTLALGDWRGDMIDIRKTSQKISQHPWWVTRGIASILAGPDPKDFTGPYSKQSYEEYCKVLGAPEKFKKYKTIYVDSVTVAANFCFSWSKMQKECFTDKGVPNLMAAYGLHGRECIDWLRCLQHSSKNIVIVGILDKDLDDLKRTVYSVQIEGKMTGNALPGIFDQIVTLQHFNTPDGKPYRAFVTKAQNQWDYPGKDRSGCLTLLEPPHLGKLIEKIEAGVRLDSLDVKVPAPAKKKEVKQEEKTETVAPTPDKEVVAEMQF